MKMIRPLTLLCVLLVTGCAPAAGPNSADAGHYYCQDHACLSPGLPGVGAAGVLIAQLTAAGVVAIILVHAVMRRLEWLDCQPVTSRMKRGARSRWWRLAPVVLVLADGLWWFGNPEPARWVVALCAGAPFLFATERFWARLLGRKVSCGQCGDLGRLSVGHAVEAVRLHSELSGHDCEKDGGGRDYRKRK